MDHMIFHEQEAYQHIASLCQQALAQSHPDERRKQRLQEELARIEKTNGLATAFYTAYLFTNAIKKQQSLHSIRGLTGSCLVTCLLGISHFDPVCDDYEIPCELFFHSISKDICFNINLERGQFHILPKILEEILSEKVYQEDTYDKYTWVEYVFDLKGDDQSVKTSDVHVDEEKNLLIYHITIPQKRNQDARFSIRFLRNRDINLLNDLMRQTDLGLPEWSKVNENMLKMFREHKLAGISEFGSDFLRKHILNLVTPNSLQQAARILGIAHGMNVWLGNGRELILEGYTIDEIIAVREDVYNILIRYGIDREQAFEIMVQVGKGKTLSDQTCTDLINQHVPAYLIESCQKIDYLFPYCQMAEYCMMVFYLGWYKAQDVHQYYAIWHQHLETAIQEAKNRFGDDIAETVQKEDIAFLEELNRHPQ